MDPHSTSDRRARAALAGHRGDAETARELLSDPSASVRATALAALQRCGKLHPGQLRAALVDPDATVRRRAAELAARHAEVSLLAALADPDALVAEMAAWACGERVQDPELTEIVESLVAMTMGHADSLVREAVVAAIGALFAELDDGALPGVADTRRIDDSGSVSVAVSGQARNAVLTAMADKATVRRRAVLALSAFDGPEIDSALRVAGTDRDWQVREAAETLLALGASTEADE